MEISKFEAQKKLALLWFVNTAILTLIFILFTVFNRFDGRNAEGWAWYSQSLIPVVSLMLGTFYVSINDPQSDRKINRFYYRMCYGISIFYLLALYLTLLLAPIAFSYSNISIMDLLDDSKIYLVIIQGVLTYALGLFFTKQK